MKDHNKPTDPYGYISFPKKGPIKRNIQKLSNLKPEQEMEVIEMFIKKMNSLGRELTDLVQLPEDDFDFTTMEQSDHITIQLTELKKHEFTLQKTALTQSKMRMVLEITGDSYEVDSDKHLNALRDKIVNKTVTHRYQKPRNSKIWLVIFSTSYYGVFFYSNGNFYTGAPVDKAREHLKEVTDIFYDEIWYFPLVSNPHRIWPPEQKSI